jgi:murein DD-endopeptidase MepM/ murein hydrolase activator NlpD
MTHRHWLFHHSEAWKLKDAGKNGAALDKELVTIELLDLMERLEGIKDKKTSRFDVPVSPRGSHVHDAAGLLKSKSARVFTLAAAGLVMAVLFLSLFISTMQYGRMLKTVLTLNDVITTTSQSNNETIDVLSTEMNRINQEIYSLKDVVFQEKEAFEFNKKQTSMNLRWLASRFPRSSSSRAKAYEYLADRIEESETYGEMVFQMSRLPENNDQAETLMATDRSNRLSMDHYSSVFPGLILPVNTGFPDNDDSDFMISSGFIERRLSPLGSGGVKPHLAVDIINLDNIIKVSEGNDIIRDASQPGYAQAVYPGIMQEKGFDWVYGWHAEVRHELMPEVQKLFPQAQFWTSYYAHMEDDSHLSEGASLDAGDFIGKIGNTGKSTGPHLHFELRVYHPGGQESNSYGTFDRINPYKRVHRSQQE